MQFLSVALMSMLAPLLADLIQSVWILCRKEPARDYEAVLFDPFNNLGTVNLRVGVPIVFVVEALMTFLLLFSCIRARNMVRWAILIVCCAAWTYVAFISIAPVS